MKQFFKPILCAASAALIGFAASSCESSSDEASNQTSGREAALAPACKTFVSKTVVPVYTNLADASVTLLESCEAMQAAFAEGRLTTEMVNDAGQKWIAARKYWELSEAFLYGAAGDYNIDPHIDSWPLDRTELESLLNDPVRMGKMDDEYAGNFLGYGLLGFHALEYMLFEDAGPRAISKYTAQELVFTVAVAGDLRNQCVRLEASWAGTDAISRQKYELLEEAELLPSFDYGYSMSNAGSAGSKYKNYLEAVQEILQGCIDIADEVGNQKIGRPATGSTSDDKNYIESPYSHNSKVDFIDNIRSIRNAYMGTSDGDASVSDFLKSVAPEVDTRLRAAIDLTISSIEGCETPFVDNATSANWKAVVGVCNDLVNVLEEAQQALL